MHFFYIPDIDLNAPILPEEEAKHAVKVLRMSVGNELIISNGKGLKATCRISTVTNKKCELEIISKEETTRPDPQIQLVVAPTKNNDRLEWMLEKATEIGITSFVPIICERSERKVHKLERLEKIAIAALKQSQQAWLPEISEATSLKDYLALPHQGQLFIAHCNDGPKRPLANSYAGGGNASLLIGPEGDFSEKEVKDAVAKGFQPVSLGTNRLRTETAALFGLCMLHSINQS